MDEISVIDQRILPHEVKTLNLTTCSEVVFAIKEMVVRGAPLIGVTAAWGVYFALKEKIHSGKTEEQLHSSIQNLLQSRPTAVNLAWAVQRMMNEIAQHPTDEMKLSAAYTLADAMMAEDAETCRQIGIHGLPLIEKLFLSTGKPVNIMTHCNAGWLACVDYGTATSPMYLAHEKGIPIHVWVSETRPRLQGAITSFELSQAGIPNTVISDNAAGLLMRQGKVDLVIVGSDRVAANGDVANKIGTYLKALAAFESGIPFYAALPLSTIDISLPSGNEIPIEERSQDEVLFVQGRDSGITRSSRLFDADAKALNYGFDVTPAKFVSGLITEKGIISANEKSIRNIIPSTTD